MSDIVERLRDLANPNRALTPGELWNGLNDGADEIERLRSSLYAQEDVKPLYDKIEAQQLELERLIAEQARKGDYSLEIEGLVKHKHKLEAEVERLRVALAEVRHGYALERALEQGHKDQLQGQDWRKGRTESGSDM